MHEVIRGKYRFSGSTPDRSAKYFDIVMSHGYDGDMDYLAWDAAHKFCNKLTIEGAFPFGEGIIYGERGEEAFQYIREEYKKAYEACEEYGRRRKMLDAQYHIYREAERLYGVEVCTRWGWRRLKKETSHPKVYRGKTLDEQFPTNHPARETFARCEIEDLRMQRFGI